MAASFVNQLAVLQLPKNKPALHINKQRLNLIIKVDQRAGIVLAIGQFGAVETLDIPRPEIADDRLWQAAFLSQLIKRLHDRIDSGAARGELGLALFSPLRLGYLGDAEPADDG